MVNYMVTNSKSKLHQIKTSWVSDSHYILSKEVTYILVTSIHTRFVMNAWLRLRVQNTYCKKDRNRSQKSTRELLNMACHTNYLIAKCLCSSKINQEFMHYNKFMNIAAIYI